MSESYSVRAILSAEDKNFSSIFKKASSTASGLGDMLKSGLGFGVLTGVGQKAFEAISSGVSGMISNLNESSAAWKTFQGNMEMNGKTEKQISSIKGELQDFATKTIYSASDMASTFAQLDAVGTKNTTNLVKGFGGLAAAAENPKQAMKTLSQQATQMAAKPTVAWQDFKLMLEQTPAGIAAVAKEMGMSTQELVKNVQDGKIKTEDFFDAISKVGTNDAFTKLATQYKTVGQAMDGLTETASNKLAPTFDVLSTAGIGAVEGIISAVDQIDGNALADKISGFITSAGAYWDVFKEDAMQVGSAFGDAVSAIMEHLGEMNGAFGSAESVSGFSDVMDTAAGALTTFAGVLEDHAGLIASVIDKLPILLGAYMAFKAVNAVAPGVSLFGGAILKLAGGGISGLAAKLLGVAAAETAEGTAASVSATQTLAMGAACLMLGAGIALACAGLTMLATAAINIANTGPAAAVALVGMVAAIAGLAVGAAALGPALTAGAVGFIAFGAAIALVGAGALAASAALSIVAGVLPTIAQYGASGASAITSLGTSMMVFATGAALSGVACVALGAGLIVVSVGAVAASAGIIALSVGTIALGAALILVSASVVTLSSALPTVATGAASSAAAFTALLVSAAALGVTLVAGSASITAFGVVVVASTVGVAAFGVALTGAGAGAQLLVGAMKSVSSSTKSIANNADRAQKSLKGMQSSVSVVSSGLDALGGKAKSAVNGMISSFSSAAKQAKNSGKQIGDNMQNGVKSGISKLPTIAKQTMYQFNSAFSAGGTRAVSTARSTSSSIVSALRSAYSGAYSAGSYIGQGLASGMRSALGTVRSVAAQLAAAADAAIRAKAQIHSPSRVTQKTGGYIAQGLAVGIAKNMQSAVDASVKLADSTMKAFQKANGNYKSLGESLAKKYKDGMNSQVDKIVEDTKNMITANVNALKKKNKKAASSYSKAGSALTSAFTTAFKAGAKKAISAAETAITTIGEKYQKLYDSAVEARQNFRDLLGDVGSLYTVDSYGYMTFKDFKAGTAQINAYAKNLEKLKKILPKGFMDEILQLDTTSGLAYTNQLLKMSTKDLKAYGDTYTAYQNAAKKTSNNYYQSELDSIKKNFNSAVTAEMKKLQTQLKQIGKNAMQGFVDGMNSKKKTLDSAGKSLANSVLKQFKSTLKIHSPSKELYKLGGYSGQGYVNGLEGMKRRIARVVDEIVSLPAVRTPELVGGFDGTLSEEYGYYHQAQYTIVVPVEMDGREVARVTAPYTEAELNKRQTRSNRKRGIR